MEKTSDAGRCERACNTRGVDLLARNTDPTEARSTPGLSSECGGKEGP
jgi:hypothetical protein